MAIPLLSLYIILTGLPLILYLLEKDKVIKLEEKTKSLPQITEQIDEQAKIIIKTDFTLNKVREELDTKITGLYTLHELGKKISSTFNIEELFTLISQPLVYKLNFSNSLIIFKDTLSGKITIKTGVGYTEDEFNRIVYELNSSPEALISQFLNKNEILLVNRESKKIAQEDFFLDIFKTQCFLTVPILVKDEPIGFILMGNASDYSKVTQDDAELLSILASQISTAIENSELYTELFKSHQELERRVKERTQELAKLNEELKRLNKTKSDFVSAVSHELRTPLTSIKGYASILIANKLGKVTPEQKERLEKIDVHATQLTHLINNLLDIARIESGKVQMEIRELSIKTFLDSIVDVITPQIKEKAIQFNVNIYSNIEKFRADPSQLERVLLNLLSNAIKFTSINGKIDLYVEKNENDIIFSVQDNGIGVQEKDIGNIFEEFFRSDNVQDPKIKGTGLGLSLVKKIIEMHKGRIWVKSTVGKGSTFSFSIPK